MKVQKRKGIDTMTYQYEVNIYQSEDTCNITKTNNVSQALSLLMDARCEGIPCEIIDGYTGEVLAHFNMDQTEDYVCPLWNYVIYGWLSFRKNRA
jgi:hypothetical protein